MARGRRRPVFVSTGHSVARYSVAHEVMAQVMATTGNNDEVDLQIAFVLDFTIHQSDEDSAWTSAIAKAHDLKISAQNGPIDIHGVNSVPETYEWLGEKMAWFDTTNVVKFGWYQVMLGRFYKQQVRVFCCC